jgi:hypothetical protein
MKKKLKRFVANKHIFLHYLILGICVPFFSGCIKYYKVLKKEVPQGGIKQDHRDLAYHNLCTSKLYDEFKTLAIFHAIFVSKDVQERYCHDYCSRRGISNLASKDFRHGVYQEHKNIAKFFLITDLRQKDQNTKLDDKNPYWAVYLKTHDNKTRAPRSIKEVSLYPEYQAMFGHRYSPYHTTYEVIFNLDDKEIDPTQDLALVIGSPLHSTKLEWNKETNKKQMELLKDEDFYWS